MKKIKIKKNKRTKYSVDGSIVIRRLLTLNIIIMCVRVGLRASAIPLFIYFRRTFQWLKEKSPKSIEFAAK